MTDNQTLQSGFVDIQLLRPVDVEGAQVGALRMREPTVDDQLAADALGGTDAMKEVTTFANLCGVSPVTIRKLPLRDYRKLQAAYMTFID